MLKTFNPSIDLFIENYTKSISYKALASIKSGKKRFVFNGPAGVGKNFLAEALANEIKASFEVINLYELTDDTQSVSSLFLSVISKSIVSRSLFQENNKIIYVEDIDKILSVDPGILQRLNGLTEGAIIIFESESGEIFRSKYKRSLSGYEIIRFYKLNNKVVKVFTLKLLAYNKLQFDEKMVDRLVAGSRGNLQSIITDINTLLITKTSNIDIFRNSDDSIFSKLSAVFSGKPETAEIYFASDLEAKNFEIWLADKGPQVLKGEQLYHFFEALSAADIILNKIKKQNWALLKYVKTILIYSCYSYKISYPKIDFSAPKWDTYYK